MKFQRMFTLHLSGNLWAEAKPPGVSPYFINLPEIAKVTKL